MPGTFRADGPLEAIEKNVAKVGFHTTIRILYLAPRDIFDDSLANKGVRAAFNQYGTQNLNYFAKNYSGLQDTHQKI